MLQLVPPKVVGIVVDGVTRTTLYYRADPDVDRHHGADCRCGLSPALRLAGMLFGASYQLAVELREDYYRQLAGSILSFYLRHRTGLSWLVRTNDVDRVVFAAWRRGADAGGFTGNGLRCVDYDVYAN
ncbi:hypothetical protein ACVXG9_11425 [Escherichia coli]